MRCSKPLRFDTFGKNTLGQDFDLLTGCRKTGERSAEFEHVLKTQYAEESQAVNVDQVAIRFGREHLPLHGVEQAHLETLRTGL